MNSLLNLLKERSGYSQAFVANLVSLLKGKHQRTLFELGQHMMDEILTWSQKHKLRLASEKSEILIFTKKRKWQVPFILKYMITRYP